MQLPIIMGVNETSFTLQWNEPPPALAGDVHRIITLYAVTVVQQNGGDLQVAFVPAETDAVCVIRAYNYKLRMTLKLMLLSILKAKASKRMILDHLCSQ